MKKKVIFLDLVDRRFYNLTSTTASSKPRLDVERTFKELNYDYKYLYNYYSNSIDNRFIRFVVRRTNNFLLAIQMLRCIGIRNKILFLQYPFLNKKMFMFVNYLKKNNKIIVLFHDIESFRSGHLIEKEKVFFDIVDIGIVHTEKMKSKLEEMGCTFKMQVLVFFDYYSEFENNNLQLEKNTEIVFAGNLVKSPFVNDLSSINLPSTFYFYLYGKPQPKNMSGHVIYKGVFESESIQGVKGNWGLVWDGDDIDTCSGLYGEYLKINAPFKFSLYLALGIPVIVWDKSAMASYVRKHHLGIVVKSLREIPEVINRLEYNEKIAISENIANFSKIVRNGEMLKTAINKSLELLSNS